MLGKEIAKLVNEVKDKGKYEIDINTDNYNLSSIVYIYQLQQRNKLLSGKFV